MSIPKNKPMERKATIRYAITSVFAVMFGGVVAPASGQGRVASPIDYSGIAAQVEESLKRDVLEKWYPRAVDKERGGFHQNYNADWRRGDGDERSVVYQSRLTWMAAEASKRYPKRAAEFVGYAKHGVDFLRNKLWDAQDGGFFWAVGGDGKPLTTEKHAYGISFALYAAATTYRITRNPQALELARRGFDWLDARAHDDKNGGYYEALQRDGKPILTADVFGNPNDAIGTRKGLKSMNTHIHLLEAFTALYEADKSPKVRVRLQEVFDTLRNKIASPDGYLRLYFTPDWKPASTTDSYGHDIETAFLLAEAAEALGKSDDSSVRAISRRLVDHTMKYGLDEKNADAQARSGGGFYDSGPINGVATNREKIWWTQAEALNALLLMHERYGRETPKYGQAFVRQWEFIRKKQIDAVNGGWRQSVRPDGTPIPHQIKSDGWTDPYHQGRALLNVSAALRRLSAKR